VYDKLKYRIEGLLKILLQSKSVKIAASKVSNELLVLGNGPSLKTDYQALLGFAEGKDVLGVNYFAVTHEFMEVKPRYHVITSLQYWNKDENQSWDNDRKKVFESLIERVSWELHLFVPVQARKSVKWIEFMSKNPLIKINYFNVTPLDGDPKFFKRYISKFKALPRPHNVLVPSLIIGINLKYNKIYLAGAEHSWIPEIFVTKDNVPMVAQKHFYHDQFKDLNSTLLLDNAKPFYRENSLEHKKLHEILQKFYYTFKSYWFIKEFASFTNTEIINLTEGSYIDAFEKKTIHEITAEKTS